MGVGAGLYMCDVVKKFTFAISSPDEFLLKITSGYATVVHGRGCSPHRSTTTYKPGNYVIMTSLMTS